MIRAFLCLLALLAAVPAAANLAPADLASVGASPPPGARLPEGLRFVDQNGRPATIASARVPTVLLFIDYTCRHLCGPGLTLTAGALADAQLKAGRDYRLIAIGMDGDGPAAARAFAAHALSGLPGAAATVQLLTGSPGTVARAEAALGYHAVYDRPADQWAHDAASFVLTPDDRLSRVLPETAATPDMLTRALASAAKGETAIPPPTVLQRIVTVCYGLSAASGVHGRAIVVLLRIAGVATLVAMAWGIWRLARAGRRPA